MSGTLAADVSEGVHQLEEAFPGRVSAEPDDQGGAYVTIRDVPLSRRWNVPAAPVGFQLPYNYPAAPPYPFYLPTDAAPPEPWPGGLQRASWRGKDAIQVSLRHNNWNPAHDTAVGTILQVRDWLCAQ